MNVSLLNSISKLLNSNPNEIKTVTKLVSLDVLQHLGNNKYTISLDDKILTTKSQKSLNVSSTYWAKLNYNSDIPELSQVIKQPQILHKRGLYKNLALRIEDIKTIISSKEHLQEYKTNLLEKLVSATTKDEFSNTSNLLLSLHHQVATIVLEYHSHFSILQLKKRYNNKTKKTAVDFYAALEFLGPIGGVIYMDEDKVMIDISVTYEKTVDFLEQNVDSLSYKINISLLENINPLYVATPNSLLDVSI